MKHIMAAAALALALAGCATTADPLPEGSSDFPTSSRTTTTDPPTPAAAERNRVACKQALRDYANTGSPGDMLSLPACASVPDQEIVNLSEEVLAELEDELADIQSEEATANTCDVAREAFLTGTDEEIEAALKALVADRAADATAREAAQSYLEADDPTLRGMHKDLVQLACQTIP